MGNYNTYGIQQAQKALGTAREKFVKNSKIDELKRYVALINNCVAVLNTIISNKNAYEQKDMINTQINYLNNYFSKISTNYTDMTSFSWLYDRDPGKIGDNKKKEIAHTAFIYYARNTINKNLSSVRGVISNDKCFQNSLIVDSIEKARDELNSAYKNLLKQEDNNIKTLIKCISKTQKELENLQEDIQNVSDDWKDIEVKSLNV